MNKDGDTEMKIVGGSEETEAVKINSRKKKRRSSKRVDAKNKNTTDSATQSASATSPGCLDSSLSIANHRSEAEIGKGDAMKQVKQDGKGLVRETCEISTSAGKCAVTAEVVVSDSTVSCEKNHTCSVVSVLNKDGDAEIKIVSTPGESEKGEVVKTKSRKRKTKRSSCPADGMNKEITDPAAEGYVMMREKQDGEGLVRGAGEISTSEGKNVVNDEVIVSDSTVSCEKNHISPVVGVLNENSDLGGSKKTEAVKTKSRKKKRKSSKCPADAMKIETTDPTTQSISMTRGGCLDSSISILNQRSKAEIGLGGVMKKVKQVGNGLTSPGKNATNAVLVSDSAVSCEKNHTTPLGSVLNKDSDAGMKVVSTTRESEKTEVLKTNSRKRKRKRSKHHTDDMKKETTDPATQSTSTILGAPLDLSISILNQRSEAEIGHGDVMKQVKQDGDGLVIETCETPTSAGKNTVKPVVIVSDSTVSCKKNHTSVGNVLNKDGDAGMKIVSTPGESEKTVAIKTNSKKRKKKCSEHPADAKKEETTDPVTQSAPKSLGGCLDSSISILNQRSDAEIGQGDVMKQVKQDSDAETKIVSLTGVSEQTELVKTSSRKKKPKWSAEGCAAARAARKKETPGPSTEGASRSAGCSILNQISEVEIGQGDVMKEVKQDGEGLVIETSEILTSAGKNAIDAEVILSDATVSCEKNHTFPVVSVLSKDDAEMNIVSISGASGESVKTEAVKTNSRKRERKRPKCPADAMKEETTDPATQSAPKSPDGCLDSSISIFNQSSKAKIRLRDVMKQVKQDGEGLVIETCEISTSAGKNAINAEVILSDAAISCEKNNTSPVVSVLSKHGDAEMNIVSTPGETEKTESVKTKSRKRKRKRPKCHADAMKEETTDPATQSTPMSPDGCLDSSTSILNQSGEAKIGSRDAMKRVKQDGEGLVIETCEISTSARKNAINAEAILSDATVSCEKNKTSPVVSVLSKDGDAEMNVVSTLGESEKTEGVKTNSRKRKRKRSKCPANAMKKEITDPATQSAPKSPNGCLDSGISILNQSSEAKIGPGDVMKQVKQVAEESVIEIGEISSAGRNSLNLEVIVSDSAVSCGRNHTSPVLSVWNENCDLGASEKTEAVKTKSRKRKTKRSKLPPDTMKKETTDLATQSASRSPDGCLESSISILDPRSEAENVQGDVMNQLKQDGKGLVTETYKISISAGKTPISAEAFSSDSTVSCEKSHRDFFVMRASADFSTIDHPVQQHEQKIEEFAGAIRNNNQPALSVLQDECVRLDDSGCCSMQTSDSLSRTLTQVSKRKLLVLDVNGILVDVAWTTPRGPKPDIVVSKKGVFKRPFCDDFLKFCFERFDVGVWSSRVRVNLDKIVDFVMGDSRKRLLFCWDQSHCTPTGHNTLENQWKPLVLKELSKLWEKQVKDLPWEIGYYNETNTFLLDDSPYKALRNPPNTAVFVHPYSCTLVGDQSLGPDGDLRKYLIRLSEAENVQKFIKENPFGQDPITESSPHWDFYCRIARPTGRTARGKKASNGSLHEKNKSCIRISSV